MKIKYNKKNLSISIVIGILCILLTSGIVVQIRTVQSNISISNPDYANNDLRDQVLKSKEKYDNAFAELEKVNKELEKYRTKVTDNDSSASEKQEELKKDNAILGLNDVTGEGIIVTLDDNKNASVSSVTAGDDISNYLVHEIDLLKIVNELKTENEELKQKNSELEKSLREFEVMKTENEQLKQQLNLAEKYGEYKTVPGTIISRDISNYSKTLVINIGSDNGIKEKMTVLADEGLVGYVISTTNKTAKIQTIVDSASATSCIASTTSDTLICN